MSPEFHLGGEGEPLVLLHGFPLPHTALARQLTVAFTETAIVLAAICLWQLVVTVAGSPLSIFWRSTT